MNLILAHRRCDLAAVALAVALGVAAAGDARAMGAGGGGSGGPPRAATDGAAPMSERDARDRPGDLRKRHGLGCCKPQVRRALQRARGFRPRPRAHAQPGSRVESTAVGMGAYTCVPE